MLCPRCGRENRSEALFCDQCGTRLATGAVSRFASPQSYTPKHLAEKILTSKSAIEGERKGVTVMFADVSGFTAMSERLDPEDVDDPAKLGSIAEAAGMTPQDLRDRYGYLVTR